MFKFNYLHIANLMLLVTILTNTYLAVACDEDGENSQSHGYMMCFKKESGEEVPIDCRVQAASEDLEVIIQRTQKQAIQENYRKIFKKDETDYKKALNRLHLWFHESDSRLEFINRIATHSAFKEYRGLFDEFFIKCNSLKIDLFLNNDSTLFRFHEQLLEQ